MKLDVLMSVKISFLEEIRLLETMVTTHKTRHISTQKTATFKHFP